MKVVLFLLIICFSQYCIANWTCIPDDGKTYSREAACPCACFTIPAGAHKADLDLQNGSAVENVGRKTARIAVEQGQATAALAKLNRLKALRDQSVDYNNQEIQEILKSLLERNVLGP